MVLMVNIALRADSVPFKNGFAFTIPSTVAYERTYSLNRYASSDYTEKGYVNPTLLTIPQPGKLALIMDGAVSRSGGGSYWFKIGKSNVDGTNSSVMYAHNGRLNIVFLDGHVQQMTSSEMTENYSTHASPFWRYDQ